MNLRIDIFYDGILFGFTYYPKEEVADQFDFYELNLYILFIRITFIWY